MGTSLRDSMRGLVARLAQTAGRRRYFQISLATRYRWYLRPVRSVLMACCIGLCLGIVWSVAQTVLGYEEVWRISAELERIRQQDQQVLAEAAQEAYLLVAGRALPLGGGKVPAQEAKRPGSHGGEPGPGRSRDPGP